MLFYLQFNFRKYKIIKMLTIEDVLKLKEEDLTKASFDTVKAVRAIQKRYKEIEKTLYRLNNICKLDCICKYCGCNITKGNKYIWSVCTSCKTLYHRDKTFLFNKRRKENGIKSIKIIKSEICDENCLECKHPDCIINS